jgi:hypothetical protein
MFEKYTYKQKCQALIVVFFMLCATTYKRSFSALIQVISEYKASSEKALDFKKKTSNTASLMKEIEYLNKTLGKEGNTKEKVQQEIISFISQYPEVSINDMQPLHIYENTDYKIITNQLDATGNSNSLLAMSYELEKKFDFSRIVGLKFYTTKKNNKSEALHLKIIFQNYENTK